MGRAFFSTSPGRITSVGNAAGVGNFKIVAPGLTAQITAIVSSLRVVQKTASQFQPSLDRATYVTTFGDELVQISIELLIYTASCSGDSDQISEFLRGYKTNRLRPDMFVAGTVAVGSAAFSGFLVGAQLHLSGGQATMPSYNGQLEYIGWAV